MFSKKLSINDAIIQNDEEQVKTLLDTGTLLPEIIEGGYTPLTWASKTKNGTLAMLIIKAGANIKQADTHGTLPQYSPEMNVYDILSRSDKKVLYTAFSVKAKELFFCTKPDIIKEVSQRTDNIKRFGHVLGVGTTITIEQKSFPQTTPIHIPVDTEGLRTQQKSNAILQELIVRYLFHPHVQEPELFLEILQGIDNDAKTNESRISKGSLAFIVSGYRGHTTATAIYKNYLIYANRPGTNHLESKPSFHISIYKLSSEQKQKIISTGWLQEMEKSNDAPHEIALLNKIVDSEKPMIMIKRSPQKRGHCGLSNPKALIEGIIYVHNINREMKQDESLITAQKIYKTFTSIARDTEIDKALYTIKQSNLIEKKMYLDLFKQYLIEHHGITKISRFPSKFLHEKQRAKKLLLSLEEADREEVLTFLKSKNIDLTLFLTSSPESISNQINQAPTINTVLKSN